MKKVFVALTPLKADEVGQGLVFENVKPQLEANGWLKWESEDSFSRRVVAAFPPGSVRFYHEVPESDGSAKPPIEVEYPEPDTNRILAFPVGK